MATKEGARQEDTFIAVGEAPDPCKTPPTNSPIPYQVVAKLDEAVSPSPDVRYQGKPVVLVDESSIAKVQGDEAGSGGGVKSGTHQDEVKFVEGSSTVKVNGNRIVRAKDAVTMNKGNTKGKIQSLAGAAPAGGVTATGEPAKASDPQVEDPRPAPPPETVTKTYSFQAVAFIQREVVPGPPAGWPNPYALPTTSIGCYEGDGANRQFNDSNEMDQGKARINITFDVILTLVAGRLLAVQTEKPKKKAGVSRQLSPTLVPGENDLKLALVESLDFNYACVRLTASCHNSLAPGSRLTPIRIQCTARFALNGEYLGMKGRTSGYPWIQIRAFTQGRAIDNIKLSPAQPDNPLLLATTAEFQSHYWR